MRHAARHGPQASEAAAKKGRKKGGAYIPSVEEEVRAVTKYKVQSTSPSPPQPPRQRMVNAYVLTFILDT